MEKQNNRFAKLLKRTLIICLCLVMALGTAVTIMAATFNGDLDGDGKVTAYDAQLLAEYQAGERDLDPATVIGLTVRGIIDRVLGRVVDEPVVDDGVVEKTVEVETADGVVTEALTFTEENVTVTVPEGVKVTGESLTLTVTKKDASDGGVTPEEGQELLPLDIHIEGVAEDNTTAIVICVAGALDTGLNLGNVTLYHVENGEPVAMTQVMDVAELTAHNTFYYDPATGDISVAMASFSEITMISDTDKAWGGSIAQGFAGGDGTEEAPYLIANADQLAYMSQLVSGDEAAAEAHYKLISDVNMNGEYAQKNDRRDLMFYPIGYWAKQVDENGAALKNSAGEEYYGRGNTFTGVFDGNGNTIANIYQNTWLMDGTYDYGYWNTAMGLFGAVYGATIKNLTMDNFQCDGETAPVGCIATYAGGPDMLFENIQLTNCNPRTYNVACGGIAGYNYNSTSGTADEITFLNITVDQTNKISALWGSYGVSGGSLLGRLRENSRHDGTNNADQINQVIMENCHMATIMDVNNDCCSNYQWYLYCYAGMVIGTVDYLDEVPGVSVEDVIKASNCTVTYGDWNEYWYCELVKNTIASYTHDHQFGRLTEIDSVSEIQDENGNWIKEGGFVIANEDNTEAECYHIFKHSEGYLYRHFHDVEDETNPEVYETTDVNGDGVIDSDLLKEDHQCYYIPFNQLWIGYNRGCKPMYEFEGIEFVDGGTVKSRPKFEAKDVSAVATNTPVKVGDLFESVVYESELSKSTLSVFVSPVGENSTAAATFSRNMSDWAESTLTFSGKGAAKVVITDYFYCTSTVLIVGVGGEVVDVWTLVTDASDLKAGDEIVIVNAEEDDTRTGFYALSTTQNTNNRGAVAITKNDDTVEINSDVQILTLETGAVDGTFGFNTGSGYLYAAASSANHLKTHSDLDENASWLITIEDGVASVIAQGEYTRNMMQYNPNNGATTKPLFSCYEKAQIDVAIYEKSLAFAAPCEHTNTTKETIDATCTEAGSVKEICDNCGKTVSEETIAAPGHTWQDATCEVLKTCTVCGATEGELAEHNYVDGVCSVCGAEESTTPGGSTEAQWIETALADIDADDVVVITMTNNGTTWAMTNANGTGSAPAAEVVTVSGNLLTSAVTEELKWNISNSNGSLTIYPNGKTDTWLYCTNTNNGVRVGTNTASAFTIDSSSGYLKHTGTNRYVGVYTTNPDWRCYTNTTGNIASQTLKFYVLSGDDTTGGEQTAGQWTLVTDIADLTAGDKIVITNADGDQALSTAQNSNNRGQTSVTKSGDTITFAENAGVQQITLEAGTTSGSWAFNIGSGYLYAASSGSNYLRTESTLSANSSWTITITNGTATVKAQGTNTRNWLRYNSSSSIFSCYASGQGDICIYKWVEETP